MKRILLAGGCFWGVEAYYKKLKGVIKTQVGYANGNIAHPHYEDLKHHVATHSEAVEIVYDETQISLPQLLEHLFRFIDPLSMNRQGGDIGIQYRTGIYYQTEADAVIIRRFMAEKQTHYAAHLAVEVLPEANFYPAEDYHQDYLDKNPGGYCHVNLNLIRPEEKK